MKLVEKKKLTNEEEKEKFMAEIQILKQLDHPNILKIFEFYQDKKNYYLIIELCTGGELFDKIIEQGSFSEKEASYVMKQLLGAVYYAHSRNIAHRYNSKIWILTKIEILSLKIFFWISPAMEDTISRSSIGVQVYLF